MSDDKQREEFVHLLDDVVDEYISETQGWNGAILAMFDAQAAAAEDHRVHAADFAAEVDGMKKDAVLFREERRKFGRYQAAVEILLTMIDNVEYISSDDETRIRAAIETIDKEK